MDERAHELVTLVIFLALVVAIITVSERFNSSHRQR